MASTRKNSAHNDAIYFQDLFSVFWGKLWLKSFTVKNGLSRLKMVFHGLVTHLSRLNHGVFWHHFSRMSSPIAWFLRTIASYEFSTTDMRWYCNASWKGLSFETPPKKVGEIGPLSSQLLKSPSVPSGLHAETGRAPCNNSRAYQALEIKHWRRIWFHIVYFPKLLAQNSRCVVMPPHWSSRICFHACFTNELWRIPIVSHSNEGEPPQQALHQPADCTPCVWTPAHCWR